jgi:DMSO/TMAO reductase YedYZ molybdopterin-dependent catalytic subunit
VEDERSTSRGPTVKDVSVPKETVNVGRRVFLGIGALGALGVVFGNALQNFVGTALGSGLGGLLPGGDRFRIYSITGSYPQISEEDYRLRVSGLVDAPTTLTLSELKAMPQTSLTTTFQCVTGWSVPDVAWVGVKLSDVLAKVGVQDSAVAVSFDSYDGADTESLTIDQANLPDVLVAYSMLDAPITTEHGGPVRLYVAPMFGYKSLKWLSAIRVVDQVEPGFWEQNGYPTNGWLDGSTGPTNPDPELT